MGSPSQDQEAVVLAQAVFHFSPERPSFDDLATENGFTHWSARKLMELLGYSSWDSFWKVVNKAIGVCTTIGIDVAANFLRYDVVEGQQTYPDWKLSRFACYLVAMNGDPKKPGVAHAQAYFATIAEAFQKHIESASDIVRVEVRQEVSEGERMLSGTAQSHGVENYAFFRDAGYRGLYNMRLSELQRYKASPNPARTLFDFMSERELAANLFRITETRAAIEAGELHGQRQLEAAAHDVGREVRQMMTKRGGPPPEDLPLTTDIKKIKSDLKRTQKGLNEKSAKRQPEEQ